MAAARPGLVLALTAQGRHAEARETLAPLLAEDPDEAVLPLRPPGEEDGAPCTLTALGRRLVGIDGWGWEE